MPMPSTEQITRCGRTSLYPATPGSLDARLPYVIIGKKKMFGSSPRNALNNFERQDTSGSLLVSLHAVDLGVLQISQL